MSLFISQAHAAAAPAPQGLGEFSPLIMLAVFGLFFFFMIIRPQKKRVKEHKDLMAALSKGDEVLTQGGLIGKIAKVSEEKDYIVVTLSETSDVTVQKAAITAVLPKGTMKSL